MTHQHGYFLEDLKAGQEATFSKTVSEDDIVRFAELTGDTNPIHLDEDYAKATSFGGRIAHGMLTAAFISAVLGTRLPGPGAIYMSQTLRFKAPVRIGDTVEARVVVSEIDVRRRRVTLDCTVRVGDTVVVSGEAQVLVPSRG